jgi:hypothetical protein
MTDIVPITGQPTDRESLKQWVLGTRPALDPADPLVAQWPADALDRPLAEPVELHPWNEADYAHMAWEKDDFSRAEVFGLDDRTPEGRLEALEAFCDCMGAGIEQWESLCADGDTSEAEFQEWLHGPFDWMDADCNHLILEELGYGVMYWLLQVLQERGFSTDGFRIDTVERSTMASSWTETEFVGDVDAFNALLARAGLNARLAPRNPPGDAGM